MIPVSADALLERYETMHALSGKMLAAAKQADWELLVETGRMRDTVEDFLRANDTLIWNGLSGNRKATLIEQIIAMNVEIRKLTEERVSELREHIDSVATERKLKKAYE